MAWVSFQCPSLSLTPHLSPGSHFWVIGFGFPHADAAIVALGRRICPGSHLAVRNMFLAFARLLYCFEFEEVTGHEINVLQIDPLAHAHPPFKIRIVPRSEEHVALIERECGRVGRDI